MSKTVTRTFNNIAKTIKVARDNAELSQNEFSHAMGYKNGQFTSNIERGLCSLPLKKINDVAEILDIDASEIKQAMINDYIETLSMI